MVQRGGAVLRYYGSVYGHGPWFTSFDSVKWRAKAGGWGDGLVGTTREDWFY